MDVKEDRETESFRTTETLTDSEENFLEADELSSTPADPDRVPGDESFRVKDGDVKSSDENGECIDDIDTAGIKDEPNKRVSDSDSNLSYSGLPRMCRSKTDKKSGVGNKLKPGCKIKKNSGESKRGRKRGNNTSDHSDIGPLKTLKLCDEKDDYEFGKPYVLLTQQNGAPITCYMLPQQGSDTNKFIATSSVISPQIAVPVISRPVPQKSLNQAILITPKGVAKTLTKVTSPFPSSVTTGIGPVQNTVAESDTIELRENQKRLEDHAKSTEQQLIECKKKLDVERKNGYLVKVLQEKLINKRRQIKTMCTQKKRLTKRLDGCREELEKTRKALELVETQAILWNNLNMSDLGKLIFSLHTGKNKMSLDSRGMASRAPPEVKGFVISLFMTSPLAYQLVRDCFNGLPHPKTVSKWLHGERVDDSDANIKKPPVNEVTLEETFSRVIDGECVKEDRPSVRDDISAPVIDNGFLNAESIETECAPAVDDGGAIYYVLDEKGNVTGQLTDPPPDIVFSSEGFELAEVSQHEVVIAE